MDFLAAWDGQGGGGNISARKVLLEKIMDKYRVISGKIDRDAFGRDFESGAGTLLISRVIKATTVVLKKGGEPTVPKTRLSVFLKTLLLFFDINGKDYAPDCVNAGAVPLCRNILLALPVTRQDELVLTLKLLFKLSQRRPESVTPEVLTIIVQLVRESSFEPYAALCGNILESQRDLLDVNLVGGLLCSPHLHVKALSVRLALYLLRQPQTRPGLLTSVWIRAPSFVPQMLRLLLGATGKEQYDAAVLVSFLVEYSATLAPVLIDEVLCTFLLSGDILSSSAEGEGVSPRGVVRFDLSTDISVGQGPPQSPFVMAQFMVDRLVGSLPHMPARLLDDIRVSGLLEVIVHYALEEARTSYDEDTRLDRLHEKGAHASVAQSYLGDYSEAAEVLADVTDHNDRVLSAVALLEGLAQGAPTLKQGIVAVVGTPTDGGDYGGNYGGAGSVCMAFVQLLEQPGAFGAGGGAARVLAETARATNRAVRTRRLMQRLGSVTAFDTEPTLVSIRHAVNRDPLASTDLEPGHVTGLPTVPLTMNPGARKPTAPKATKTMKQAYKYPAIDTLNIDTGNMEDSVSTTFPYNPWEPSVEQETTQMLLDNMTMTLATKPATSLRSKVGSPRKGPRSPKSPRTPHSSPRTPRSSPGQSSSPFSPSAGTGTGTSPGKRGSPHSPSDPMSSHYSQSPLLHRNLQEASEEILREVERKDKERLCSVEAMLSHNRVMALSSDAAQEAVAAAITEIASIMAPDVATDVPELVALPPPGQSCSTP